jgi:hypothetical protein
MSNVFSNHIPWEQLKDVYNDAIDSLLANPGLTMPCKLLYSSENNLNVCSNCIFDPITKLSSNIYNGSGPKPFSDATICPVCMGGGSTRIESFEIIYMAVLFDSRYWLDWESKDVNVAQGQVQTICLSSLLPKIRNAKSVIFDTSLEKYRDTVYQRAGDPKPVGFGNSRYIFTMWENS